MELSIDAGSYEGHRFTENINSNLEIRNSKQYRMTKIQMIETVLRDIRFRECRLMCFFLTLEHYRFEFVSDFDIRPALARLYWDKLFIIVIFTNDLLTSNQLNSGLGQGFRF